MSIKETQDVLEKAKQLLDTASELPAGPALVVEDRMPLADRYLSDRAKAGLSRKSTTLVVIEHGKAYMCHYLGVSVPVNELEAGVKKVSELVNGLADRGLIHSALAPMFSLELVQDRGRVPTIAICSFVLVPAEAYDALSKEEYAMKEGDIPKAYIPTDIKLGPGELFQYFRYSHVYQELAGEEKVQKYLEDQIAYRLKKLGPGARHVSTRELPLYTLARDFEVVFYSPELAAKQKVYTLRRWNSQTDSLEYVDMTAEQVVQNSGGLNLTDVGIVLLMDARLKAGLPDLLPEQYRHNQHSDHYELPSKL